MCVSFISWWIGFSEDDGKLGVQGAVAYQRVEDNAFHLNLQLLWKPRENSATRLSDQDHIFQPRSPESGVVQAGLNGQHLSIF